MPFAAVAVISNPTIENNSGGVLDLSDSIRGDLGVSVTRPFDRSYLRVPAAGLYRVTGELRISGTEAGVTTQARIRRADQFLSADTSLNKQILTMSAGSDNWHDVSAVLELTAGQHVGFEFVVLDLNSVVTVESGMFLIEKLD